MKKIDCKIKKPNDKLRKLETDWWDEISDEEKASIERGLEDVKAGRVVPHDEVRKKYFKWLKK